MKSQHPAPPEKPWNAAYKCPRCPQRKPLPGPCYACSRKRPRRIIRPDEVAT